MHEALVSIYVYSHDLFVPPLNYYKALNSLIQSKTLITFISFGSLSLGDALEHFGYKAPDLQFFYESIWYDLSRFENWFMDRRGGYMALFTRNRYFCLPAPISPESDSSDDEDGPTRLPAFTIGSINSIAMQRKARSNVSPMSWASISPTIILPGSNLRHPYGDASPKKDDPPKSISLTDVSSSTSVTIPTVVGSSSPMEQSSLVIAN